MIPSCRDQCIIPILWIQGKLWIAKKFEDIGVFNDRSCQFVSFDLVFVIPAERLELLSPSSQSQSNRSSAHRSNPLRPKRHILPSTFHRPFVAASSSSSLVKTPLPTPASRRPRQLVHHIISRSFDDLHDHFCNGPHRTHSLSYLPPSLPGPPGSRKLLFLHKPDSSPPKRLYFFLSIARLAIANYTAPLTPLLTTLRPHSSL